MKKITYLSIVFAGLAFASCKKDRVCECTYTSTAPGSSSSTYEITVKKVKKGVAADICESTTNQTTAPVAGYINTDDCKLK
ncbi:MAG: hypothetical protein SGJ15_10435 [Bacteroidota bacterium]|nr:hypothetical protein [Bacteroidota bacterium]